MPTDQNKLGDTNTGTSESTLERFLQAVEKRTTSSIHHRLLKACRQTNQVSALESELKTIVSEIINEA